MTPTETHDPILLSPISDLIDIGRLLERHVEKALPVQLPTLRVLEAVAQEPGIPAGQLATWLEITPQTLSATLARMLRDGLIERFPDAENGRIQHHYLTSPGTLCLEDCRDKLRPLQESLVAGLSWTVNHHDVRRYANWLRGLKP